MVTGKKNPEIPQGFYTTCGGRIQEPERYPSAMYQGRLVYFCNKACMDAFKADPVRFMSGEIEHPLE